jgi:hypothetical protein
VSDREVLMTRLDELSERQRTAFAVGCAERVLCLYDLDCQPDDPRIKGTVALCWRYAGGEEPLLEEIEASEEGLRAAMLHLDAGGLGPAYSACMALVFALDAIDDPTAESAVSGASSAVEAVDVFEDYFEPGSRTWSVIENEWQLQALAACESADGDSVRREVFASLGPLPPGWFRSRDADYEAGAPPDSAE